MCKSMHTRGKNLICKYLLGLTMTKLVSLRSMSVYVDLKVCAVQFVYIPMDAYILYMQVLHGCLAVAELVSYRHLYM